MSNSIKGQSEGKKSERVKGVRKEEKGEADMEFLEDFIGIKK